MNKLGLPIVLLLGVLTFVPAVFTTFILDDYVHAAMVTGRFPGHRQATDLYNFIDDTNRRELFDRGFLPWWSDASVTIRFLRPLGSVLVWADHVIFVDHPLPMHVHSLLWWGAAVLAARALYRQVLSGRVLLLATAIFALSPSHVVPLAWVANRESLIALTFGAIALGMLVRRRRGPTLLTAIGATATYALAFLGGGEYALAFGGYVVAIEIARRREADAPRHRALRVLAFALPAGIYLAVRTSLRYGALSSGFYSDPFADPLGFLRKLPLHALVLLGDGWLTLDAEHWATSWAIVALLGAVAAVAYGLMFAVREVSATLDPDTRQTASWLLWGSLLAMLPGLAASPHARLLGVSTLGIAAVIARILDHAWFHDPRPARRGVSELLNVVATALAFAHLVHGPVTSWLESRRCQKQAASFAALASNFQPWLAEHGVTSLEGADVAILRSTASAYFMPFALDRTTLPGRWRVLAQTGHVLVQRIDERTLDVIASKGGSLCPPGEANLFRDDHRRLRVGDRIVQGDMRALVRDVTDAGPRIVRFTFDDPQKLAWTADRLKEWEDVDLPAPGFGAPFDP